MKADTRTLKGDARYSYRNGWAANVWFLQSNLHNLEVLNPHGHALELAGPCLSRLGPLKESIAALILFRVSRLLSTDSDEHALATILSE